MSLRDRALVQWTRALDDEGREPIALTEEECPQVSLRRVRVPNRLLQVVTEAAFFLYDLHEGLLCHGLESALNRILMIALSARAVSLVCCSQATDAGEMHSCFH